MDVPGGYFLKSAMMCLFLKMQTFHLCVYSTTWSRSGLSSALSDDPASHDRQVTYSQRIYKPLRGKTKEINKETVYKILANCNLKVKRFVFRLLPENKKDLSTALPAGS